MTNFGKKVTLDVLIHGAGSGKFPQATLTDADGNALAESPLDLTHLTGTTDVYRGTFIMPNSPKVIAETLVYDDAPHTVLSFGYPPGIDEFRLEPDLENLILRQQPPIKVKVRQSARLKVLVRQSPRVKVKVRCA